VLTSAAYRRVHADELDDLTAAVGDLDPATTSDAAADTDELIEATLVELDAEPDDLEARGT
jgi:hypothetical protein